MPAVVPEPVAVRHTERTRPRYGASVTSDALGTGLDLGALSMGLAVLVSAAVAHRSRRLGWESWLLAVGVALVCLATWAAFASPVVVDGGICNDLSASAGLLADSESMTISGGDSGPPAPTATGLECQAGARRVVVGWTALMLVAVGVWAFHLRRRAVRRP